MEEEERLQERISLISAAKRNCILCSAHRGFNSERGERERVLEAVRKLKEMYEEDYNAYRAGNASAEFIKKANAKRRHCMDVIDKCRKCNRNIDRVNRLFPSV